MRVLQANKFFYARGGAERYFLDLVELLPAGGHPVAPFSMHHPRNTASSFSRFFVSHVDYAAEAGPLGAVATAMRTIYNRETRRRARDLVREFRPDVAHLHNIHHQLSGSLYEALHEEGVPIVQSLHDYQWACPVYTFVSRGKVCEACKGGRTIKAVRRRCHGGSLPRSIVAALELQVGRWRDWESRVRLFLAPSAFMGAKMTEHGLPGDRMRRLNYCLRLERYQPRTERGRHALFAGRLSAEKGLATLIRALTEVPGMHLRIAGTGPVEPELRRLVDQIVPGRVTFLGHLSGEDLHDQVGSAAFVVVPSEWYENQPFAVLESFALETPVVGARIGGIPELVRPGETGMLFESGSVASLATTLKQMEARTDLVDMGRRARVMVEQEFDPGRHLEALLDLYREVAA